MKKNFVIASKLLCYALITCCVIGCLPMAALDTSAKKETQIVVAARKIPVGTKLSEPYLKMVDIGNAKMPPNAITDMSLVLGKYAKAVILEDEYIYEDQLSTSKVNGISDGLAIGSLHASKEPYVWVTDYVSANTGKDVVGILQAVIDKNPNRTIYFPDGEYLISSPLFMSGLATNSVSLRFSDGAVLKATNNFKMSEGTNALIGVGVLENESNIKTFGSYYSIVGGTFDGNGKAETAIFIRYAREFLLRGVTVKNARKGIYVERGVPTYSADVDIEDVTVIGKGEAGSKGLELIGTDCTFTNIRIYDMETGLDVKNAGSLFKNIYIYNTLTTDMEYGYTVGIRAQGNGNDNWYSQCYVENYAVAYQLTERTIISDCNAKWTSGQCNTQTFITVDQPVIAIGGCRAEFFGADARCAFLNTQNTKANKIISGCSFDESLCDDKTYLNYIKTNIIPTG